MAADLSNFIRQQKDRSGLLVLGLIIFASRIGMGDIMKMAHGLSRLTPIPGAFAQIDFECNRENGGFLPSAKVPIFQEVSTGCGVVVDKELGLNVGDQFLLMSERMGQPVKAVIKWRTEINTSKAMLGVEFIGELSF